MSAPLVAVVQFPGSNCEYETARAVRASGMRCRLYRWNMLAGLRADAPDAYVLPGGFSYQDRVRAGAVAARERVMDIVFDAAAAGAPVLGICNGAQILVESGMVPGEPDGTVGAALAHNHVRGRAGYLSAWVFVRRRGEGVSPWLLRVGDGTLPLPVAHAEGRFVLPGAPSPAASAPGLAYCDQGGCVPSGYPVNPNGSMLDAAAVSGASGRVLAMMPHPERAARLLQLPPGLPGAWGVRRRGGGLAGEKGPGALVFDSLRAWLRGEEC